MNVRQDLFGAASGSGFGGHYCPEGVPVELGLLSILAAFGVAFGVLYIALTLTTAGRRKKRSKEDEQDLVCRADDVEQAIGCKVAHLTAANPRLGKIVDLVWHGESISTNYQLLVNANKKWAGSVIVNWTAYKSTIHQKKEINFVLFYSKSDIAFDTRTDDIGLDDRMDDGQGAICHKLAPLFPHVRKPLFPRVQKPLFPSVQSARKLSHSFRV